MKTRLSVVFLFFVSFTFSQSKTDKEEAYKIGSEAIVLMDEGNFKKSIQLLEKAKKLDPENYLYPYEIGYAYFLQGKNDQAIKVLEKVVKIESANDQCFTLLGNAHDLNGNPEKALEVYTSGLQKFPHSGRLHYEYGVVLSNQEKHDEALQKWEDGIVADPTYPSNYYMATIYFCQYSTERIWGVFYGETFMNIERGSKRTETISKLLFDTYSLAMVKDSSNSGSISFSKQSQIFVGDDQKNLKLPFSMRYEAGMAMGYALQMLGDGPMTIARLSSIRTTFIENWLDQKLHKEYPNTVLSWQKELMDKGHLEAYNYWLLMKGSEAEFSTWYEENKESFDSFIAWFSDTPLPISEKNCFSRMEMD